MSFDRLLLHYLSLSKESLSIDCQVSIPRTLINLFQSIISSISFALQRISFNRLLRQYPSHSQESLSIDCYISFSRTLRNFLQSIVSSVSLALKGVSFNRLLRQYQSRTLRNFFQSLVIEWLRQYLSDSQDSLQFYCYASISHIIVQAIFTVMKVFLELLSTWCVEGPFHTL